MKKYNIKLDHTKRKIIIGKDFNRKQSDTESPEFKKLCEIVERFPKYRVIIKEIKKNSHKESYRGLNYSYMEKYISIKGTRSDRQEYDDMRLLSECHSKRFSVIKQWFLKKYPEVAEYGAKEEFLTDLKSAA